MNKDNACVVPPRARGLLVDSLIINKITGVKALIDARHEVA